MASVSSLAFYSITKCSSSTESYDKINGSPSVYSTQVDALGLKTKVPRSTNTSSTLREHVRLNIPQKKQLVDPHRQAVIVDGVIYRQTLVIRSYEVGPDKTATIESILSLFQEAALNHVWNTGLLSDGYGATHQMKRHNLIWVVSSLQVEMEHYPMWGEIVTIDTWVAAFGKNGMRRDWILRSKDADLVFGRGTSTWCMMDRATRRLARMPEKVRGELSQWFSLKKVMELKTKRIGPILDDKPKYANSNFMVRRNDLDVNNHVNNIKYARWMLESVPDEFQEKHELTSIRLEYKRECRISDNLRSVCQPLEGDGGEEPNNMSLWNGFSERNFDGYEPVSWFEEKPFAFTHKLQTEGQVKSEEILRGTTSWKKKPCVPSFEPSG